MKLLTAQSKEKFEPIDFIGMQDFGYWDGYDIHNWTAYRTEALAEVKAIAGDIPIWVSTFLSRICLFWSRFRLAR